LQELRQANLKINKSSEENEKNKIERVELNRKIMQLQHAKDENKNTIEEIKQGYA